MEDGCDASLYCAEVPELAMVNPLSEAVVGDARVRDLRKRKKLVIPKETEKIGNHWFCTSDIETVKISASVREICVDAFCNCRNLRSVVFAPGSRLEKMGSGTFCGTEIRKIVIPESVTEIQEGAFWMCENLREVIFKKGSKLRTIGKDVFGWCISLEKIILPEQLSSIEHCAFFECEGLKNI